MSEGNGNPYGGSGDQFHRVTENPTREDERQTRTLAMKVMQTSDEWIIMGRKERENGKHDIAHGGIISTTALAEIMVQLMVNNPDLRANVFAIYAKALDVFFDPNLRRDNNDGQDVF